MLACFLGFLIKLLHYTSIVIIIDSLTSSMLFIMRLKLYKNMSAYLCHMIRVSIHSRMANYACN